MQTKKEHPTTIKLRELRKTKNITIKDMAEMLGFRSPSAYCKKELMQVPFTLDEAQKTANFFGMSIDEIFL